VVLGLSCDRLISCFKHGRVWDVWVGGALTNSVLETHGTEIEDPDEKNRSLRAAGLNAQGTVTASITGR